MRRIILPLLAAALSGCALGAIEDYEAAHASEGGSTSGSTGEGATTFSSVTIDPHASAGSTSGGTDAETTGADGSTSDDSTTEGPSSAPPTIASYTLSTRDADAGDGPLILKRNGPIFVEVDATDADGVRVEVDDGTVVELSQIGAQGDGERLRGELAVVSALANGEHLAQLVPYREGFGDGGGVTASYTVALPPMGEELLWKVEEYLGEAWVVDVAVLSTGDILEFGTKQDADNQRRCFLRRRNHLGAFVPSDVVTLLGGDPCEAVDIEVRDDQVFLLATWEGNGGVWWLGHTLQFGDQKSAILALDQGEPGEVATALALREDGALAVCGSAPTGYGDRDAFASVWEPGELPVVRAFDYVPEGEDFPEEPHRFDETPRDCLFVGEEQLVLLGEAHGKHDPFDPNDYFRRFLLPLDLVGGDDPPSFIVAAGEGPGDAAQSVASSADVDEQGRLAVTGYACDKLCKDIQGHLWVQKIDGELDWFTSLSFHEYPHLAPSGVRWHPGGYAIVSHGGTTEDKHTLMLRAFSIYNYDPLWTYMRADLLQEHFPLALTVGPYGEICAGGFGNGVYPGLACVGS